VRVTDAIGLPISGVAVTFTVTPSAGGASGTFATTPPMPILTNANGSATAPTLTASDIPGTFSVKASAGTLSAIFGRDDNIELN
jgi:hypothetical protein